MIKANKSGIDFARIDITLVDGTALTIDGTRLTQKGLKIEDACSNGSKFTIGYTTEKVLTLIIKNTDEYYSLMNFDGAIIKPFIINSSVATQKGTYKANKAVRDKGLITITAYDDMCRLEYDVDSSKFTFPATHQQLITQIATACGIQLDSRGFSNSALSITEMPNNIGTYRDLAGYIAQCAGSVFRQSNSGIFGFYDYNKSIFPAAGMDGGDFLNYNTGDTVDGGNFTDYTSGATGDGGNFTDRTDIHNLTGFKSLKVGQNDTVITGIRITVDKTNYDSGTEDYMLTISKNPLITKDNVNQVLTVLATKYIGLRFRTISCSTISDFRIEAMDPAYACDLKGNVYQFYVTKVVYTIRSYTSVTCAAETKDSNAAGSNNKTTTKLLQLADEAASKNLNEAVSNIDDSMQQLNNQIAAASGLYTTVVPQWDGSNIYYMHDKSTMAKSQIIFKFTAQAFGISTDGGATYPYGLDASGDMVMNTIAARGILFDYAKGGTITLGGSSNANGILKTLDASGNVINKLDNTGLTTTHADITGGTILIKSTSGTASTEVAPYGFKCTRANGTVFNCAENIWGAAATIYKPSDTNNTGVIICGDNIEISDKDSQVLQSSALLTRTYLKISGAGAMAQSSTIKATEITTDGNLKATGTKNRIVSTEHYGDVLQNAVESPTPTFEDYGEAILDENGDCRIYLDDKFVETIDLYTLYNVFITKYGAGDIYIANRQKYYFDVKGTANLNFSWCLKATQKDYNSIRLTENTNTSEQYEEETINYSDLGATLLSDYEKEISNEESNWRNNI